MRSDMPREQALAYWRGPHAQLIAGIPEIREYRQHHFDLADSGLRPEISEIETKIPDERRIDGMPEVTLEDVFSILKSFHVKKLIPRDEVNVFERVIFNITAPGWGRWFRSGYGEDVGFRAGVLLRRRPDVPSDRFRAFVNEILGSVLAAAPGILELRTQVFLPWIKQLWNSPGVAHDNPKDKRFHAIMVAGAADRETLEKALISPAVMATKEAQSRHCGAIHAYSISNTYVYLRDGRRILS